MFSIIIVMGNVLIAQISERYTDAKSVAAIQYDIDKAWHLVRIERSLFSYLHNKRKVYFRKGLYVSNAELVQDLLADWNTYGAKDEGTDEDVRRLVEKKILKQK